MKKASVTIHKPKPNPNLNTYGVVVVVETVTPEKVGAVIEMLLTSACHNWFEKELSVNDLLGLQVLIAPVPGLPQKRSVGIRFATEEKPKRDGNDLSKSPKKEQQHD